MKVELSSFDVYPRVVRAGQETEITIAPLYDHARFGLPGGPEVRVSLFPAGGGRAEMASPAAQVVAPQFAGGGLRLRCAFAQEQEYILVVEEAGEPRSKPRTFEFRLYALAEDLFQRRPYKGDLHMHSTRSDGNQSPAYVAGACRRIGLDFMALTDHRQYEPSLEAMRAYAGVAIDLQIFPGEEVHPPENPVHMVNFGASFSVNAIFREDEPRYRAEVAEIAAGLKGFPEGLDRYAVASCEWVYRQIRAGGGLGIFCHPYWFVHHRYDVPEALVDQILERQPFDAMEVVGGYYRREFESNALQIARYHEERARGKRIPAVGVSDAHNMESGELFGWYFTLVFAPAAGLGLPVPPSGWYPAPEGGPALAQSIRDLYSVAVEAIPDEMPRAYGPFRLVKYAQFLLREVLPQHDALCLEEGRLMLAHAAGDPQAAGALRQLQGRAWRLYDHLWARE